MSNIVAIVGRPNVGKSTLFNRLTETRDAIVDPTAGVTRDRHYGKAEWCGRAFTLIDTGGFTSGTDDIFEKQINRQVEISLEEADVIIFLLDVMTGITDFDTAIAQLLRQTKKPVLVVANKVDNYDFIAQSSEFYSLGLGQVHCISANNGSQTGDMLDELVKALPVEAPREEDDIPKIALIGRPNVGKSSMVNALLGHERAIVTPVSGTTRDSINTRYSAFGFDFYLVDTAGIRKKAKVKENVEFYSTVRSLRAIEEADVCVIMVDATQGFEKQDVHIFYDAVKANKGVVILINKWDLVEKDTHSTENYKKMILERIAPFVDVPVIFTSTVTKQRIHKAIETAVEVYHRRNFKIPTSQLNEVMQEIIEFNPPPALKGKYVRIKFIMQLPTYAPAIAFFCNLPQYIKDPYKRFLENKLRENFDFTGVPLRLFFRKK